MGNNAAFIPQWWETMKQGLRDWKQWSYNASKMRKFEAMANGWETMKLKIGNYKTIALINEVWRPTIKTSFLLHERLHPYIL